MQQRNTAKHTGGLSLVETVIVVAVLGLLAAAGIGAVVSGVLPGTEEVKFQQNQSVLNSAVRAFQASGGDLSAVTSGDEVLALLRTEASPEQRRLIPGLSGSFLDSSLEFVVQTPDEAATESLRLLWNEEKLRFDLSRSGAPGIIAQTRRPPGSEESKRDGDPRGQQGGERKLAFTYSAEGAWIWDYADAPQTTVLGPTSVETVPVEDSTSALGSSPPPGPVYRDSLLPPKFSIAGGSYPRHQFNLALTLDDQNPHEISRIYYSANYGNWQAYSIGTSISVAPHSSIKAQAVPLNPDAWEPSMTVEEIYQPEYSSLRPPEIDFDEPYFVKSKTKTVTTITVSLADVNEEGLSRIRYRILPVPGGEGPETEFAFYDGPFTVDVDTYPQGFGVRTYASAIVEGLHDSRVVSRYATERTELFGGHLDLDTSTFIAEVDKGGTDAHTHDILAKIGGITIDFFSIPESKQIEITEAIPSPTQQFQISVVNANLSPGMTLLIDYESGGRAHTMDLSVDQYDDTPLDELTVYTLGGVPGTAKLTGLRITMNQDLIYEAAMLPSNTGDVRSNVLGKDGEWRNGSLTLQALAVNDDGTPAYTSDPSMSNGDHGVAVSGLFWEAVLFWHWKGDSYHEEKNTYTPRNYNSIRLYVDK